MADRRLTQPSEIGSSDLQGYWSHNAVVSLRAGPKISVGCLVILAPLRPGGVLCFFWGGGGAKPCVNNNVSLTGRVCMEALT